MCRRTGGGDKQSTKGQTMDFIREQAGFIVAIVGGLIISVMSSEKHSLMVAVTRVSAGLFASVFLADPFIHYMGLEPETYRNGVAGLFAMMGYAITKFVANIDGKTLIEIIKAIRGGK